jgi:hypothetical protein
MENVNWRRQGIDLNQFVKHSGMEIQQIMSYYIYCQDTPISSSNKIQRHDATEILLKVALNSIILTPLITSVWQ